MVTEFQQDSATLQLFCNLMRVQSISIQWRNFVVEVIISLKQENQSGADPHENKEPLIPTANSNSVTNFAQVPGEARPSTPYNWFLANSFAPAWLPKGLRHPIIGYLAAILLQIIATLITLFLVQVYPSFAFMSLLEVLAVVLVSLNWGAGPSLLATVAGAALLNFVVQPPHFAWTLTDGKNIVEVLLFLLVGFTISIVASQFGRTRRSAAELAASLMTERARLEAVIDAVPDAVSIHDAQGTVVRLNRMGLDNAGAERSSDTLAVAQRTYAVRTLAGEPLPLEDFPAARALRGETVSGINIQYLDAKRQDRFASLNAAPLRDAQGRIDGAILITHDVTTLHQSQREAEARANELETIFEAMTDSIFVFNSGGQMLRVNAAARELFTLDAQPEDHSRRLQEHKYDFTPYDDNGQPLPEEQRPLYRVLHGEILTSANSVDVTVRASGGQELQLNISGAPMRNKEGNLVGAVCICRDVTERRQLEKRTQETLNALLAMAETLVLIPDSSIPSGQLTPISGEERAPAGVSRVAQRLVELTRSVLGCERVAITTVEPETNELHSVAVIGLSPEEEDQWRLRTPGFNLNNLLAGSTADSQLHTNEAVIVEMTQPPYSNEPNPYNITVMLIVPMSVGDQLVGILSLDYGGKEHEYSPNEIALAKAVAKLAALVIERERLLRERAEARANELALREANRRMDEFLGMTSHELKTPLTSIKGNTQLTVRQLRNSMQNIQKMQGMLESTERQVNLLDRLVDDLLDISRNQTNQLELSLAPCNLASIVVEAVEEQRRIWLDRTINLDFPAELVSPVFGDSGRLSQVVTNYLINALKYSPDDRPIQVSLQLEDEQVRVSVQDQGIGLSPDEQTRIWDRFYRAEGVEVLSSSHTSMQGLGLGLYICKAIIEQQHGSVGVESTPNAGSTFWFTLPLAQQNIE